MVCVGRERASNAAMLGVRFQALNDDVNPREVVATFAANAARSNSGHKPEFRVHNGQNGDFKQKISL